MWKRLLVIGLLCASAFAERPFSVEDAGVIDHGGEIEVGYSGTTIGDDVVRETGIAINYALFPAMQVGIEKAYFSMPYHPWGTGDLHMVYKYNFAQDQALKIVYKRTDGDADNGFGTEVKQYDFMYAHDLMLGQELCFLNLGYSTYVWKNERADAENNYFLGLANKHALTENFFLCTEITKIIVVGDYLDPDDGQVIGLLGFKYESDFGDIDLAYQAIPQDNDYVFMMGLKTGF